MLEDEDALSRTVVFSVCCCFGEKEVVDDVVEVVDVVEDGTHSSFVS